MKNLWRFPYWLLAFDLAFDVVFLSFQENVCPAQDSRYQWLHDGVCMPNSKFDRVCQAVKVCPYLQSVFAVSSVYWNDVLFPFHPDGLLKPQ
ncbi:hypothetical protein DY000_02015326 [Brassica cretica]|uniref:Secreted protein n=1 Tax=Brassica cretica TaxID=69181 RepID=A0ABQ7CYN5_BRACR|nr:hypothetical protein DY000_02015326 [Brassica cretica]